LQKKSHHLIWLLKSHLRLTLLKMQLNCGQPRRNKSVCNKQCQRRQ